MVRGKLFLQKTLVKTARNSPYGERRWILIRDHIVFALPWTAYRRKNFGEGGSLSPFPWPTYEGQNFSAETVTFCLCRELTVRAKIFFGKNREVLPLTWTTYGGFFSEDPDKPCEHRSFGSAQIKQNIESLITYKGRDTYRTSPLRREVWLYPRITAPFFRNQAVILWRCVPALSVLGRKGTHHEVTLQRPL